MYAEKLDAAGNPLWFRTFSRGNSDQGHGIGVDSAGNVYLGGMSADATYSYDYYVQKYSPTGSPVWTSSYDSGALYDWFMDLEVDAGSGSIYALGNPDQAGFNGFVTMKFSSGGALAWARNYQNLSQQATSLTLDSQGNIFAAGGGWMETSSNDWDFLTLKYDPSGNLLYKKSTDAGNFVSPYDGDFALGVAVDAIGSFYVAGASYDGSVYDALLVKSTAMTPGPGEASVSQPMTVQRGAGSHLLVQYAPACGATDHVVVWGTGPLTTGVQWTQMICNRGVSGNLDFDPQLTVTPGSLLYFVVVGQDGPTEGSYGRTSAGVERNEAVGLAACDLPRSLVGCP